ncbi:hypothetical protein CALVIDRAFT_534658 [Calocera viscosa TUFC12733]|uniref:Uncharacterized protein n=1 Tax=Calocera viscosa (strain TUFC12733) TaxID=1330018 RepID=A0A167PTV2_CALVF|nr:hypothetical protein CALVIDRAFT_534658 [Calocera viscosa TUFC12733]
MVRRTPNRDRSLSCLVRTPCLWRSSLPEPSSFFTTTAEGVSIHACLSLRLWLAQAQAQALALLPQVACCAPSRMH